MKPKSYIVMGVSGCGKSTVGALLASELGLPFHDGDDFHPASNIEKMSAGIPLNDKDRAPWLQTIADFIRLSDTGIVIACSALKASYRELLRTNNNLTFVYLAGDKETLLERVTKRSSDTDHFMPSNLLDSQIETLESPTLETNTITVSIKKTPNTIIQHVLNSH